MITTLLVWACVILINVIVLGLVPEKRSPSSAMAWLLLILLVPVFGLLVYLLIGSPYVPRKRREEQRAVGAVIQSSLATTPALPASPDRPDWLDSAMVLNRRLGWLPSVQNNSAELFHVYEESIQAKADLVRTAERYVHVEYFILCWDSTTAAVLRGIGRSRSPWGEGASTVRPHFHPQSGARLQGDARQVRSGGHRVASHAAHPAAER